MTASTEGVEHDEDDGLQGDPAQDVADRDRDVAGGGGADGDGDLGQVRGDGEDDQPAQGAAEVEVRVDDVGALRQPDAGEPDDDPSGDEDGDEKPERQGVHKSPGLSKRSTPPDPFAGIDLVVRTCGA